ncbi:hypothetical protein HBI94_021260 [Parastagonospora nodorum]|nr:hypothetical protein HBI94_021260 [Parastagonospora nodorum]KAH5845056.1 hypothetical protein HBI91_233480 [Parastagonospora nodorum]
MESESNKKQYIPFVVLHLHQIDHSDQITNTTGVVAEWLSRKTRNLVPSGAQVRILPTSFLFAKAEFWVVLWW